LRRATPFVKLKKYVGKLDHSYARKAWGLHIFAVDWVAPPEIAPIIISGDVAMDKPASRCRTSRRSSDEARNVAKLGDKAARHAARLVSTDRDLLLRSRKVLARASLQKKTKVPRGITGNGKLRI